MPWQAVMVVAGMGVVFTVAAGYRLLRERALRSNGKRTLAQVVDQDEHFHGTGGGVGARNRSQDPGQPTKRPWSVSTNDRGLVQTPIVEFTTADGETIRTRSAVSSNVSSAIPGRVMTVYYNPANPSEVAIVGHGLATLRLFLVIGIVLLAAAVAMVTASTETIENVAPLLAPFVLGAALLGVGGYGISRVWELRRRGVVAEGTVVGETTSSTREGMTLHHPVVRFSVHTGHEIETASQRGRVARRAHTGEHVRVRYHPNDPYRMLLVGDGARPLFWIFALAGIVVLALGTVITGYILTN
ncbi:DUF3592 domain-containing protein [Phytoactinopolyspora halophila]|nr:DUF3592 domain-containing protein [Phytoactinopolyspora halophila]